MSETAKILLKQVPFLGTLPEDLIASLGSAAHTRTLAPGEILFTEGEIADACYVIKSGTIEVLKKDPATGQNFRLALRGPGEFLGEMSLLEDSPRFATAKAVSESVVLEIMRHQFTRLIGKNPSIAIKVMEALSSRLRQADIKLINDLQQKNEQLRKAYQRLQETTEQLERSYADLKMANKFLERIISASQFFIIVADGSGKVFVFNDAAKRTFGMSFSDVAGRQISDVIFPRAKTDVISDIEEQLRKGQIWRGELLTENEAGQKIFIELVAARVFDQKGSDVASLYMGRDITQEKNLERQMIMLGRMATRGEMAAEVAHELNNYLSIVVGNLELLQLDLDAGRIQAIPKKINAMKEGLDKITRFIEGLMMHSRPAFQKETFDLHGFLENELFFLKPQNRFDDVQFVCDFDPNLPPLTADKDQLQQAIYNLLNNAADAMANNPKDQKRVTIQTRYLPETKSVRISVIDTGVGLTEESLAKVFRQHFTSKESGHGFGLLAVKRVIKNHCGKVWAENNPGGGAAFHMEIPLDCGHAANAGPLLPS